MSTSEKGEKLYGAGTTSFGIMEIMQMRSQTKNINTGSHANYDSS